MAPLNRPMNVWHCARCHQPYTRAENCHHETSTICVVQHEWDMANGKLLPGNITYGSTEHQYIYPAKCCPNVYIKEIRTHDGSKWIPTTKTPCFEGHHTTNPKSVDYNGISIKQCAQAHK